MSAGVDYAWSRPSPSALKAARVAFVMRYLSNDPTKNLTATEAKALAAAGIWVGVVWESTADRMLSGRAGGIADAWAASTQAAACGMPSGRPIYFAADWDATPGQQTAINAYLDGAASVLGLDRVGVYGGYYVVKRALDAGTARWAWQTPAWSGGQWDPRAHIRQGAQRTIGGVSCDLNTSMQDDFGQWMPGRIIPEVDVALTTDDINKIAAAVWAADVIPAARPPHANDDYARNPTWTAKYGMQAAVEAARTACDPAPVALTDEQVAALGQQLATNSALVEALADAVATNLAARLES